MATVLVDDDVAFDVEVPLVIVGAGAAGLVAALAATEAGVEPLLVERDRIPRGSTALSAGLIPAAGTRWQAAAGIADSAALFAADITRKSEGRADPAIVDLVARAAGPTLEWLADLADLPVSVVHDFDYPGHVRRRMHGLPSRTGAELMDRLRVAVEARGIPLLAEARATTLVAARTGRVHGLHLDRPDGSVERIGCTALVLACNGYGGNRELVGEHIPELADALYFGHPGNQGEAVLWGRALGAASADLSGHQGHGSVAHPHGILITWATMTEGGIQLNAAGARFADESRGYSEQAADVLRQPGGCAVSVFDARIAQVARQFEDFRTAEAQGAVRRFETIAALALGFGLPETEVAGTLAAIAEHKRRGTTDSFGRCFAGVPQLTPPYMAVRVTGALFHTQGGLVVDADARVLTPDGAALPNLFAAGGAARGLSGPFARGYLSGNGLVSAVVLGRAAGRAAACRVGRDASRTR